MRPLTDRSTPVSNHLRRLASQLFDDPAERERFMDALLAPREYDRAVLWARPRPAQVPFSRKTPFAWQPDFVDRAPAEDRPGLDPLHVQGYYYCLDFSSVFAATVLGAAEPNPQVLIDVCAAPGGKSVFAWRMLQPQMLVANEVIGKRTGVLIANLKRCGAAPACVTSRDSAVLVELWPASADVVIVDAPCSGQSLLARGKDSPGCFHPATINMNSNRQKRILANAAKLVAPGGWLAYMTCTYSEKENEDVLRWLIKRFPQFVPQPAAPLQGNESVRADFPCYRLWPHTGEGAGGFTAILKNTDDALSAGTIDVDAAHVVWRSAPRRRNPIAGD
jgi:16S rRNA C967 or C1407 C5-methylase (RsmB/RsmF family)